MGSACHASVGALAALVVACPGCGDRAIAAIVRVSPGDVDMSGQGAAGQGDNGLIVEVLTPTSWARPGAVFSQQLSADYEPRPVEVEIHSKAGAPLAGSDVLWTAAAGSGWVFPISSVTDAQGRASAWWTAGPDRSQTAQAKFGLTVGQITVTLAGVVQPAALSDAWVALRYNAADFDGFAVDMTPLEAPSTTRFAAMEFANCYATLGNRATDSAQLDPWASFVCRDVSGASVQVVDAAGSSCQPIDPNAENDTGIRCDQSYPWAVNATYEFESEIAYPVAGATDFTIYLTSLSSGERVTLATLRRSQQVRPQYCFSYLEDVRGTEPSCLDMPQRSVLLSNVRMRKGSIWTSITTARFDREYAVARGDICANYQYGTVDRSFLLSLGGERVGPPFVEGEPVPAVSLP